MLIINYIILLFILLNHAFVFQVVNLDAICILNNLFVCYYSNKMNFELFLKILF